MLGEEGRKDTKDNVLRESEKRRGCRVDAAIYPRHEERCRQRRQRQTHDLQLSFLPRIREIGRPGFKKKGIWLPQIVSPSLLRRLQVERRTSGSDDMSRTRLWNTCKGKVSKDFLLSCIT